MKHYLLAMYPPDGEPPPEVDLERIMRDIHALRAEMREAGAWVFSGGLHTTDSATVVRFADGGTLTSDGPYIEGKEHLGGFTIVQVPDLDAALACAGRLAEASTLPIEVRPFAGVDAD
jgi:hypothetical protein